MKILLMVIAGCCFGFVGLQDAQALGKEIPLLDSWVFVRLWVFLFTAGGAFIVNRVLKKIKGTLFGLATFGIAYGGLRVGGLITDHVAIRPYPQVVWVLTMLLFLAYWMYVVECFKEACNKFANCR